MLKLIHLLILRNVAFYSFLYRVILAYRVAKKMNLLLPCFVFLCCFTRFGLVLLTCLSNLDHETVWASPPGFLTLAARFYYEDSKRIAKPAQNASKRYKNHGSASDISARP